MYRVRLHLGFSRTEWAALPWHDQRMYLEELAADGKLGGIGGSEEASLDDLAGMGFSVSRQ